MFRECRALPPASFKDRHTRHKQRRSAILSRRKTSERVRLFITLSRKAIPNCGGSGLGTHEPTDSLPTVTLLKLRYTAVDSQPEFPPTGDVPSKMEVTWRHNLHQSHQRDWPHVLHLQSFISKM